VTARVSVPTLSVRRSASLGPRVVLVHGWTLGSRGWDRVFVAHGRTVQLLAPDLPGQGQAPLVMPDCGPSDYERFARESLARWTEAEDLRAAPMVGWAWGARLLVEAVETGLIDPSRLFLINLPSPGAVPDPYSGPLWRDWPRYLGTIVRLMSDAPLSSDAERWLTSQMTVTSIAAAGGVHAAEWLGPSPSLPFPPGSVALFGERDRIVDVRRSAAMAEANGATVVTIPDAGHTPHIERPAEFDAVFGTWLATLREEGT